MRDGYNELLHDEVEEQFERLNRKKRNRKRKRRRIQVFVLLAIILIGALYFTNDISKVKSLRVIGNRYYSSEEILKQAGLDYDSRYLLHPSLLVEHQLKKLSLVESVEVDKNRIGGITIQVTEKMVIGYVNQNQDKITVVDVDGKKHTIAQNENRMELPFIHDFSNSQLTKLANAFSKLEDKSYIQMISEIAPHQESYDKHMVRLTMQDGNSVFVSYKGIALLTHYKEVLKPLKGNHVCLWIDEDTKAIVKKQCPVDTTKQEVQSGS